MKTPFFALVAALSLASCAEKAAPTPQIVVPDVAPATARPEVVPLESLLDAPAPRPEPVVVAPELPGDMQVVVNGKGGIKSLTVVHRGHIVSVRRGDTVVLGENSATVHLKGSGDISWESTDRETFSTLRGVVQWETRENGKDKPSLRATSSVQPSRAITSARHECRVYEKDDEPMTLICRVKSLTAGAIRVFGKKPQDGIAMAEVGENRYFRAELDTSKETFDAVVVGYSDGARGHVIRAEASKLPGETKASYSLLAASRTQPIPQRRFFHHRRPPHDFDLFL